MDDKVTVIIPFHNRQKELKRAIKSVLNQTHQNFELILVDDASKESVEEMIDSLGDERISLIVNDEKTNANVARNMGISAARGNYIAMLDSDDEWLPNHLERKLFYLNEVKADGVFGSAKIIKKDSQQLKISRQLEQGEKMINYLLGSGFAPTPTHFYKTKAIKEIMFDETLQRHQDWDISVRFANKYRFIADPEITAVVHWEPKPDDTKHHYPSQINFIEKNKDDIQPELYVKYHVKMYLKAKKNNASTMLLNHYYTESVKYKDSVRLVDFMSLKSPDSLFQKLLYRLQYVVYKNTK